VTTGLILTSSVSSDITLSTRKSKVIIVWFGTERFSGSPPTLVLQESRKSGRNYYPQQNLCGGHHSFNNKLPNKEWILYENFILKSGVCQNKVPNRKFDKLGKKVAGVAIEVHKKLCPGFLESVYHNGMKTMLNYYNIPFESEKEIKIYLPDEEIGTH